MATIVVLCTGNAARSVMAGAAIEQRGEAHEVITAGTLAVDGMPMSWRTRAALRSVGLDVPEHRSKQAHAHQLSSADVIIALAPEHVEWVRRNHPSAASRTATLIRLCTLLAGGDTSTVPLADRIAALGLADAELGGWEEVVDPGGGEVDDFIACAGQISDLVDVLLPLLTDIPVSPAVAPAGGRG